MSKSITYHTIKKRLDENGLVYTSLNIGEGINVIITRYGGRIFGPFVDKESSVLWVNRDFISKDAFKSLYQSGHWNIGGDRMWLAPEIQFSVQDRTRFWETLNTPAAMDPGMYQLHAKNDRCVLQQDMVLSTYNINSKLAHVSITREIMPVLNPLRNLKQNSTDLCQLRFAGFEQKVTLSTKDDIYAEAWNLTQVNPGGKMFIASSSNVEYVDYYEQINEDYQRICLNHIELSITGDRRYKVGYNSANIFGRIAYLNEYDSSMYYLIVKNFFNNPSSIYAEEPPEKPGHNGYSVHVYNDNGDSGGFGEMECNLQTIGKDTGLNASTDQIITWYYFGEKKQIEMALCALMGIKPETQAVQNNLQLYQ